MTRLELFRDALSSLSAVWVREGSGQTATWLYEQLDYLIDLETGRSADASRLPFMTIGVITAKEVETAHPVLAERLYRVADEVDRMVAEANMS